MPRPSRFAALAILLLLAVAHSQPSGPTVTFYVEHEVDPEKDYLEIVVNVKAEDTSLKEALADAEETVKFVREQVEEHCRSNSKKKGECQQITESGKFNVEPLYRIIRTEPVFVGTSRLTQPSQSPTRSPARSSTLTTSAPSSTGSTAGTAPASRVSSGSRWRYFLWHLGE
jgi:hypothetical protein